MSLQAGVEVEKIDKKQQSEKIETVATYRRIREISRSRWKNEEVIAYPQKEE